MLDNTVLSILTVGIVARITRIRLCVFAFHPYIRGKTPCSLLQTSYLRTDHSVDGEGNVVLATVIVAVALHVEILFTLRGVDFFGNATRTETCQRMGGAVTSDMVKLNLNLV